MQKLSEALNDELSEGFRCRTRYMRTRPIACDPLFSPAPDQLPEKTRLSQHFLLVSIEDAASNDEKTEPGSDVAVLGIEVYIYSTKALTTIFVSKADSTGYLPQQSPSQTRAIATTFLHWLCKREQRRHPTRTIVLSLFARAQSQYLFPGSAENARKHVLDDRQLIKWWARALDPIVKSHSQNNHHSDADLPGRSAFITVPGYEGQAGMRQFLPDPGSSPDAKSKWKAGNPLRDIAQVRGVSIDAPPRCLLPRFPDDPKARFMTDLDDEVGLTDEVSTLNSPAKRKTGNWKTIRNLDRFWEAMEFRQECSSGRLVGFIWLVIQPKVGLSKAHGQGELSHVGDEAANQSQSSALSKRLEQGGPANGGKSQRKRARQARLTGPIIPRKPRLKASASGCSESLDIKSQELLQTTGELVLHQDGYDKAMQTLLHLDFANRVVATLSTSRLVAQIASICGVAKGWSRQVHGTAKVVGPAGPNPNSVASVNDLGSMIRKKRKVEDDSTVETSTLTAISVHETKTAVNILGGGLVRKKPKPAAA